MTAADLRQVIADARVYASVPGFVGSQAETEFRSGARDVPFSDLEIDSLAGMELCIAIEVNTDISLTPADVVAMPSLDALVQRLVAGE